MGPEPYVILILLIVGPVSVFRSIFMCIKFLSVGRFSARALENCVKKLNFAKIS